MSMSPEEMVLRANEWGVRLEWVSGVPLWEAQPVFAHQDVIDEIRSSIRPGVAQGCGCHHMADVLFKFPDSSLKRPDIAVLCFKPDRARGYGALEHVPEAVVEVISQGYEAKDLEFGPNFYLAQGVKDVIVFDPRTLIVLHYRRDGTYRLTSPHSFALECGCTCTV